MLGVWSIVCPVSDTVGARLTAAMARCLSARSKRVLVLELSFSCPSLDLALGVSEKVVYTISDVGRISPAEVFLSPCKSGRAPKTDENILFVPCAVGEMLADVDQIRAVLHAAEADIALILADPASASVARSVSSGSLLLSGTDAAHLRSASYLSSFQAFDGLVLTDFVPTCEKIREIPALTDIADMTALPLFGILPRESGLETVSPEGKDFHKAVENMVARLCGEQVALLHGIPLEGVRKKRFFAGI